MVRKPLNELSEAEYRDAIAEYVFSRTMTGIHDNDAIDRGPDAKYKPRPEFHTVDYQAKLAWLIRGLAFRTADKVLKQEEQAGHGRRHFDESVNAASHNARRAGNSEVIDRINAADDAAGLTPSGRGPSFWSGKTMKLCLDEGCKVESHYRSGAFPVRAVRNRNGNWALWVPQEVLPSVCKRMGIRYKRPVYRGSAGSFVPSSHHSQWRHGSAKWDWSAVRDAA